MPTVAELRALADWHEAEAKRIRDAADTIERIESIPALTRELSSDTFDAMSTSSVSPPSDFRRGAPLTSQGPVATVARQLGVTSAEVARMLGVNPAVARNWDARGKIPNAAMRDKLASIASKPAPKRHGRK